MCNFTLNKEHAVTSDMMDPNLCICGEEMELEEEFCCQDCEQDFYEVQYAMHLMEVHHHESV
jgi:hypothetical protein